MFQVEFDEEDVAELILDLEGLAPPELLKKELPKFGLEVMHETMVYPPVPAGSTYKRTEKLFQGWKREILSPLKIRIFNPVDYGVYVQGRQQTAKHKQTGWKVLFEEAEARIDRFIYRLERIVMGIWDS